MSFDFSALGRREGEPGVQIARGAAGRFRRPDLALARGNAQFARGGRDPGTVSFEIMFQDPGVEDHLVGTFGIDAGLNQPEIDQPEEHGRGRFLIAAITFEDDREHGNPDLGLVEQHLDLEPDHLPGERMGRAFLRRLGLRAPASSQCSACCAVAALGGFEGEVSVER